MKTDVLLIDNFDSFTYNVYHYILMCGVSCKLLRSDEGVMQEIEKNRPKGIVLSPGPMRPQNHPVMFEVLNEYYETIPILGICLGHQAIGEFFGAELVKGPVPVHGKVSAISHTGHTMYKNVPENISVARYHSLVLSGLNKEVLEITATTAGGLPMSVAHKTLPVWGIQYHPEAVQTEYGLQMMKNWTSNFI